jgi:hypothetical protein
MSMPQRDAASAVSHIDSSVTRVIDWIAVACRSRAAAGSPAASMAAPFSIKASAIRDVSESCLVVMSCQPDVALAVAATKALARRPSITQNSTTSGPGGASAGGAVVTRLRSLVADLTVWFGHFNASYIIPIGPRQSGCVRSVSAILF